MSFKNPAYLALLIAPLLLGVAYLIVSRRRSKSALNFAHTEMLKEIAPRQPLRRHIPSLLLLLAITSLTVGLAGPEHETVVKRERRKVVLAFDVSRSMAAEDVTPTRLAVARQAASDFINDAPKDVDIGLVLFSGSVVGSQPPTSDRAALLAALADPQLSGGTAIGEAIFTGLSLLEVPPDPTGNTPAGKPRSAGSIVLLSDGDTTAGRPAEEASAAAVEAGIQVSTIAFGTSGGSIVDPDTDETIPVPYAPEALSLISEATGGMSASAEDASSLKRIFDDLRSSVEPKRVTSDLSGWFLAGSFALLICGAGLSLWWFRRLM